LRTTLARVGGVWLAVGSPDEPTTGAA